MSNPAGRVSQFVDSLLRDRRPRRFPADEDEGEALLAAAALRSTRLGADLPRPEFVAALERRLAREAELPNTSHPSRRELLQLTGVTAAAAVIGAVVDRALFEPSVRQSEGAPPDSRDLNAAASTWMPVMAAGMVRPGQAARFSAPAIEGFIVNNGGRLEALSAVCTHQGCILRFNAPTQRLDCPCHGASFNLQGSPLNREYLRPLPHIESRVSGEQVEVRAPQSA